MNKRFLILLITQFSVLSVHASGTDSTFGTQPLDTLLVTGTRSPVAEKCAPQNVITSEDIERLNIRTVAEALPYIPGIQVRRGKKGEAYVRMRGFRQREVMILVDGIPLNSAYSGQIDLERMAVDNIDRIVVSRGTPSVLFGPGGMAGVITIITKDGNDSLHITAQLTGESAVRREDGMTGRGAQISGAIGTSVNNWNTLCGGRYHFSEGYSLPGSFNSTPFQITRDRINSDRTNGGFYCSNRYSFSDSVYTGLRVGFSQGSYGKPPVISSTFDFPRYERDDLYRTFDGRLDLHADLPVSSEGLLRKADVRSSLFASRGINEENRYTDATMDSVSRHYMHTDDSFGGIILGGFDFGEAGRCNLSCSYNVMSRNSEGREQKDTIEPVAFEYKAAEGFAATEYVISFMNSFEVAAGICFTAYNRLGANDVQLPEHNYPQGWLFDYCPQAGVSYHPLATTRIFAAVGKKINNPTLRELYEVKENAEPDPLQPELVPEKTVNYETGIEQVFTDAMSGYVGFFYNDINNLIENNNTTSLYENIPSIASKGIECDFYCKPVPWLETGVQYTWLSMVELNSENRQEMQYRPQHSGTFRATLMFSTGTKATANGQFVGKQYFYAAGKREMAPYFLLGVHLQQPIGLYVNVHAGVRNITDTYYEESQGLPQSGRQLYLGMKVTY